MPDMPVQKATRRVFKVSPFSKNSLMSWKEHSAMKQMTVPANVSLETERFRFSRVIFLIKIISMVSMSATSNSPARLIGVDGMCTGIWNPEKYINHHSKSSPVSSKPLKMSVSFFKVAGRIEKWRALEGFADGRDLSFVQPGAR